jgi:hypothetical protein
MTQMDIDGSGGLDMAWAKRKIAHLALDPVWVAAAAAGDDPLLQYLFEHSVVKCP